MLTEDVALGIFEISLNNARSDLEVNLQGCSLLGTLCYWVNIHLNIPDQKTARTSAL